MSDAPDWTTLTATLPTEAQKAFLQQPATQIAAGASESITFYASSGTLVKVSNAYLDAPGIAAATSGNHEIRIFGPDQIDYTKGLSSPTDPVLYGWGYWNSATAAGGQFPPAGAGYDQAWWLKSGVLVDATIGIGMIYYNNTNAAQTGVRTYLVAGTEVDLP